MTFTEGKDYPLKDVLEHTSSTCLMARVDTPYPRSEAMLVPSDVTPADLASVSDTLWTYKFLLTRTDTAFFCYSPENLAPWHAKFYILLRVSDAAKTLAGASVDRLGILRTHKDVNPCCARSPGPHWRRLESAIFERGNVRARLHVQTEITLGE